MQPTEIQQVEEMTRAQGGSAEWFEQRCGRVTASTLKRVYTRAVTLKNDPSKDSAAILKHVMGYNPVQLKTYAIKHGKAAEPHAKLQYRYIQQKRHTKLTVKEAGLHIHPQHCYLAASPDLIVECVCHGKGCVEIKCPWVCRAEEPTPLNYSHLEAAETGATLSKKSPYYYQIQGQLAATHLQYCDFFIYTCNGYHLERITTDHAFLEKVFPYVEFFWLSHMRHEILSRSLASETKVEPENSDHIYVRAESSVPSINVLTPDKQGPMSKPTYPIVYLCAICSEDCVDNPPSVGERSIECSSCKIWVHFVCGGIDQESLPDKKELWFCDICS